MHHFLSLGGSYSTQCTLLEIQGEMRYNRSQNGLSDAADQKDHFDFCYDNTLTHLIAAV